MKIGDWVVVTSNASCFRGRAGVVTYINDSHEVRYPISVQFFPVTIGMEIPFGRTEVAAVGTEHIHRLLEAIVEFRDFLKRSDYRTAAGNLLLESREFRLFVSALETFIHPRVA